VTEVVITALLRMTLSIREISGNFPSDGAPEEKVKELL